VVERDPDRLCVAAERVNLLRGDGCELGVATESVDTIVSVQVLEHVFEPIKMVNELARVLKPGGYGVLLLPTTSTMHFAPQFHQNFSRYWIFEAMRRAHLDIVEFRALGGVWSSMASHLVYFFLQAARVEGMTDRRIRRSPLFFALLPLQAVFALIAIPICMVLSLGDLGEEPNNHAVVVRKPLDTSSP
jgi:SAM-dependent methyltransferase